MSKTIRLDEDVYEGLTERKRDNETYSEAVERLIGGRSVLGLAGILSDEEAEELEEVLDEVDERDAEDDEALVEEFG
ncbi:hypothetical protein EGH25_04860 [Haladaptatus sp. F3-133]|uniref:Uncharacterized protein n=1 Tax=Halorutilus salinus TaxID=2487751 RepID=A0A9Q4C473_9EURY|nr:antitoxin VapB family protein [Halorutilus salinus]MCX2818680.1 hypothetical protein [Halorutilus salinus]